jgi:hypothetical protein
MITETEVVAGRRGPATLNGATQSSTLPDLAYSHRLFNGVLCGTH